MQGLAPGATPNPSTRDNILLVVELNGGNDGLNTVIPYQQPAYYNARPTLGIPKSRCWTWAAWACTRA